MDWQLCDEVQWGNTLEKVVRERDELRCELERESQRVANLIVENDRLHRRIAELEGKDD